MNQYLIRLFSYDYLDLFILQEHGDALTWLYRHKGKALQEVLRVQKQGDALFLCKGKQQSWSCVGSRVVLQDGLHVQIQEKQERLLLLASAYSVEDVHYDAYSLKGLTEITIGREGTIACRHPCVSKHHARLVYDAQEWYIEDMQSKNGVYVNQKRCQRTLLRIGDTIQFAHFSLIYVKTHLYVCHKKEITVHLPSFAIVYQKGVAAAYPLLQELYVPRTYWHQEPLDAELCKGEEKQEGMPAIFALGPSITMGISSLCMGAFSLWLAIQRKGDIMQSVPTIFMSLSMAMGTILWPILSKRYESYQRKRRKQQRRYEYTLYLEQLKAEIDCWIKEQERMLQEQVVDVMQLQTQLIQQHLLYRKRVQDAHAFACCLGMGQAPASIPLQLPTISRLVKDELIDQLKTICEKKYELQNVAVELSLEKHHVIAFEGEEEVCVELLLQLLLQLCAAHSPKDVKICLIASHEQLHTWGLSFLPHLYVDTHRLLICEEASARQSMRRLEDLLAQETKEEIFVFALWQPPFPLPMFPNSSEQERLHYLFYQAKVDAYHDCCLRIQGRQGIAEQINSRFTIASISPQQLRACFLRISNHYPHTSHLETPLRFLDLYSCGSVEQLQIAQRWAQSDCTASLEVLIGIGEQKEALYLDAHEHAHGPHGLLAGMTGSGKSECLLTYLLSLAVNFSSEDVNFVLIDFKGGTMASQMSCLPHTAGVITNLKEGELQRSMAAIESEMKRRQQLLQTYRADLAQGSLDIDHYIAARKRKPQLPVMAHLFLVVDEFAELKQQYPQFLEHLKQCARIGRSLGMHLLLATQKPSGVVDEQIWSNARFHLCLKVQDRIDSMDMLKKEDAVHLREAGQFYLQVGNDEVYQKGRAAWCQAPYIPTEVYEQAHDQRISFLQTDGSVRMETTLGKLTHTQTQLAAVCEHLLHIQPQLALKAQSLWLPQLPAHLPLPTLSNKDPLQFCLGMVDAVTHQKQYPLLWDVRKEENIAVFGRIGSGKTRFMENVLWNSLAAQQICNYVLDFDRQQLFTARSHAFLSEALQPYDDRKIKALLGYLKQRVQKHKQAAQTKPSICLVFIHNYELFHELYAELEDSVYVLLREGKKVGIRFIISAQSIHHIPLRFHSCLEQIYYLQSQDPQDYAYAFHGECRFVPFAQEGSGIYMAQKELLLFQLGVFSKTQKADILKQGQKLEAVGRIPLMPAHIAYPVRKEERLYLGKDVQTLQNVVFPFSKRYLLILAAYRLPPAFLHCLYQLVQLYKEEQNNPVYIWDDWEAIPEEEDMRTYLMQDSSVHICIATMPQLQPYSNTPWYSYLLMEGALLWIGKGISDYQFVLKRTGNTLNSYLPKTQAYYWEDETCRQVQIWEVVENG